MIRRDGIVKVLDFGLAKLVEPTENLHKNRSAANRRTQINTNPGAVMGTADYMSPEQARGLAVDARTDIFSFGVMLFEMLTGEKPFTGETVSHTIVNILEKEMPSIFSLVKECPAELEKIIGKTLAKKPDEHFRSATELLKELKTLQKCLDFGGENSAARLTNGASFGAANLQTDSFPAQTQTTGNSFSYDRRAAPPPRSRSAFCSLSENSVSIRIRAVRPMRNLLVSPRSNRHA